MSKHPLLYINFTLLAIIALLILGINADNINLPQPLKALAQTASQIISGSGTPTSVAQFTGSYTLGNSQIYQDGAGRIGIGTQTPASVYKLDVIGNARTLDTWLDNANGGLGAWASSLGGGPVNWSSIANIPGDIADGDQVGITAETDPNVRDFAKNLLPSCSAAQKLTGNGTSLSCATDSVGAAGTTYSNGTNINIDGANRINMVDPPTLTQGIRGVAWVGYKWVPEGTQITCTGAQNLRASARINNGRIQVKIQDNSNDSGWQDGQFFGYESGIYKSFVSLWGKSTQVMVDLQGSTALGPPVNLSGSCTANWP